MLAATGPSDDSLFSGGYLVWFIVRFARWPTFPAPDPGRDHLFVALGSNARAGLQPLLGASAPREAVGELEIRAPEKCVPADAGGMSQDNGMDGFAALLFIDTNIFLDFYRQVGRESDLSILKHIGQHHDRIITTRQVEMEFKKHRQRLIANSLAEIKAPDWSGLKLPAYLASSCQASGLSQAQTRIKQLVETIQKRGRRVFEKPTRPDPVYKVVQRLFTANTPYNLLRSKEKEWKRAIRLAWRRFLLGYPPARRTTPRSETR